MNITKGDIIRIRAIMSKLPYFDEKAKEQACMEVTNGRTNHISDLTKTEAYTLIDSLQPRTNRSPKAADPREKMQRNIIRMAHEIGWQLPALRGEKKKIDMKRLNEWCINHSYLKKPLNAYTYMELSKLVSQFEAFYKYQLNRF